MLALKIPSIIPSDPSLWFSMLESNSNLRFRNLLQKVKLNYYVAYLSPDNAILVRDIILNRNETDSYKHLKESVISHGGESKTVEIQRLHAAELI